jgi:hypothetical protein
MSVLQEAVTQNITDGRQWSLAGQSYADYVHRYNNDKSRPSGHCNVWSTTVAGVFMAADVWSINASVNLAQLGADANQVAPETRRDGPGR